MSEHSVGPAATAALDSADCGDCGDDGFAADMAAVEALAERVFAALAGGARYVKPPRPARVELLRADLGAFLEQLTFPVDEAQQLLDAWRAAA